MWSLSPKYSLSLLWFSGPRQICSSSLQNLQFLVCWQDNFEGQHWAAILPWDKRVPGLWCDVERQILVLPLDQHEAWGPQACSSLHNQSLIFHTCQSWTAYLLSTWNASFLLKTPSRLPLCSDSNMYNPWSVIFVVLIAIPGGYELISKLHVSGYTKPCINKSLLNKECTDRVYLMMWQKYFGLTRTTEIQVLLVTICSSLY